MRDLSSTFEKFITKASQAIRVLKETGSFREPADTDGWWLSGLMGINEKTTNVYQTGKLQSELAKELDMELLKCFKNVSEARERISRAAGLPV